MAPLPVSDEGTPVNGAINRRTIGRVLIGLVLLGSLALLLAVGRTRREPVYQGQSLSQWLAYTSIVQVFPIRTPTGATSITNSFVRFALVPGASVTRRGTNVSTWLSPHSEAGILAEAMTAMGDAAIPHLLAWLTTQDSLIRRYANAALDRQSLISFRLEDAAIVRLKGLIGFQALGTNGNAAVPKLARLAVQEPHALIACQALAYIDTPEAKAAIRTTLANTVGKVRTLAGRGVGIRLPVSDEPMNLLELYTFALSPTNQSGHLQSIQALGAIGEPPETIVPLLIPCLTTPYGSLERLAALREIGESGADLEHYLPAIRSAIGDDPGAPNSYQDDLQQLLKRLLAKPRR